MQDTHNLKEVCSSLGVSRNRVEQWIARGYLKMENDVVPGSTRKVTFRDAVNIVIMTDLADMGFRVGVPTSTLQRINVNHTYKQGAFYVIAHEAIPMPQGSGKKARIWLSGDKPSLTQRVVPVDQIARYVSDPSRKTCIVLNLNDIELRVQSFWGGAD